MDSISGNITIYGEKFSFIFKDNILHINIPIDHNKITPLSSGKLESCILTGTFENDSKFVTFYVGDHTYFTGFSVKYFAYTTFQISVKFYIVHSIPLNDLNFTQVKIDFYNNKFRKWLGFYEEHNLKKKRSKKAVMNDNAIYSVSSCNLKTNFKINNKLINVFPSYSVSYNYSSINFKTILSFRYVAKTIDFSLLDSLFESVYKMLKFIFYRQNVEFGNLKLLVKHMVGVKKQFEKIGDIFVPILNEHEMESPNLNTTNDIGFIPWHHSYKVIPKIVELNNNGELYLYSLPMQKKEQKFITINSVSLIASSFEFEYCHLYTKTIFEDLDDRKEIRNIVNKNIGLFKNENQQTLVKNAIGTIFKPSLSMKAQRALNDFLPLLTELVAKFNYNDIIKEVSKIFVKARNDIDHGNKNINITTDIANALYVMRILVCCMQLKRLGLNDEDIFNSVRCIFEIF
mgnify:CR=1 FL=1